MYESLKLLCCKSKKNHVTLPFLFLGSKPSSVCQEFDTYDCPYSGTNGVLKNSVFLPWCYCGNTLLVVWKPTWFDFQLLFEMSQLWWFSSPFFYWWRCFFHVRKNLVSGVLFNFYFQVFVFDK